MSESKNNGDIGEQENSKRRKIVVSIEDQKKKIVLLLKTEFLKLSKCELHDCYIIAESSTDIDSTVITVLCKTCNKQLICGSKFGGAAANLAAHTSTHENTVSLILQKELLITALLEKFPD